MPAINERSGSDNARGPYGSVWEALERFSEALRDLDADLRALTQVSQQPHEGKSPANDAPIRPIEGSLASHAADRPLKENC